MGGLFWYDPHKISHGLFNRLIFIVLNLKAFFSWDAIAPLISVIATSSTYFVNACKKPLLCTEPLIKYQSFFMQDCDFSFMNPCCCPCAVHVDESWLCQGCIHCLKVVTCSLLTLPLMSPKWNGQEGKTQQTLLYIHEGSSLLKRWKTTVFWFFFFISSVFLSQFSVIGFRSKISWSLSACPWSSFSKFLKIYANL